MLIAGALGAEITAVCSTAKIDFVRSLGADHAIDYTGDNFTTGKQRYDLTLDIAGNTSLTRLRRVLTPRGTLVIAGGEEGGRLLGGIDRQVRAIALSPFVRQRLTMLTPNENHSHLERTVELLDGDRLLAAGAIVVARLVEALAGELLYEVLSPRSLSIPRSVRVAFVGSKWRAIAVPYGVETRAA